MRFLRKHRTALVALGVYHFIFFFPTVFMARLPSPNDVFFNYAPWGSVRSVEVQNSLINDPPTSYFTLMSLVKHHWAAFHWNPFVASGVPGFGSSASAVLSPFVLLPTLALPLAWVYAGLILLKLNAAFFFGYLWLREERLGRRGAAAGAIVIAAAGAYAVRWWWQATNATALYPALLWVVTRTMRGRRVPAWAVILIALAYAIAGFPAAMLYGVCLAGGYAVVLAAGRRVPRTAGIAAVATLLAVLIAMPSVVPFVQFLRRSGYLEQRIDAAQQTFPLRHLALFIHPDHLGNNAHHDWRGDPALGAANNYIASTLYVGLLPLALAIVAIAARRARRRWFWFAAAAVTLGAMFGLQPLSVAIGHLPLVRYSPLTQLVLILPLPAGYLSAAAISLARRRWSWIAVVIAAVIAADLAVFAGRFYPYVPADLAGAPPSTPTLAFLQRQPKPFRIAAMLNYLWPNTSELYRLEDVRSHFSSERDYRRLLARIDPTSTSTQHTVLSFNSLKFNFADPFTGMLGIRYYLEHREIDILRWTIFQNSKPSGASNGIMILQPGMVLRRRVAIDARPFYALEIPVTLHGPQTDGATLVVRVTRGAGVVFERAFTAADIAVMNKVYVPIYEFFRAGEEAGIEVRSNGIRAELVRGADEPLYYDRVTVPLMFDRELPDGRLFRNAGEVPRFHSVRRVSKMTPEAFLARTTNVDFRDEAVITADDPIPPTADADVALREYRDDEQRLDVRAPSATLLVSSEKLTPELAVTIDGTPAHIIPTNLLFAAVAVPPGNHTVVFSRRLARGWWWVAAGALFAALVLSALDVTRLRRLP